MTELGTFRLALDLSTCAVIGQEIGRYLAHSGAVKFDDTAAEGDRWMRTREAARYVGISTSELHRRVAAGEVPHEQEAPGAALFFKRADLDAWRRGEGRRRGS